MFDLDPAVLNAFIALIGVLLLVFAWRSVSGLPALARWGLRLVLTAIIVAPFAALILYPPAMQEARAPTDRDRAAPSARVEPEQPLQPETDVGERAGDDATARKQADEARRNATSEKSARRDILVEMMNEKNRTGAPEAAAPPGANGVPDVGQSGGGQGYGSSDGTMDGMSGMSGMSGKGGKGGDYAGADTEGSFTSRSVSGRGTVKPEHRSIVIGKPTPSPSVSDGSTTRGGESVSRGPASAETSSPAEAAPPAATERAEAKAPAPKSAAPEVDRSSETVTNAPEAAAASKDDKDWNVVPVYFGTDRNRVPNDKRLDYGSDRARRLELGRALVTVPKAHQVPQIERPWAITIPYFNYNIYQQKEDPKKHFTMEELKSLSEADLLALVKERLKNSARYKDHAFVFVHGYNTSFDYAIYRTAQIAYDIKFDGAPFVYSWPSGGGIASYTYDRESAAQAEPYFKQFLEMVTQKSGAKHVSIIAHSMGNQLVLRVLQDLQRTRPEGVEISQIIFAAPDVDRDSFETIASQLKGFATGGLTLYAASNDRALSVSRRFYGGVPRAGDVPAGGPLIMSGIDTIDATAVSMDSLGLHHSGYAESNTLLNDIGLLIQTGERPPPKRVPILQPVQTDKGTYWRYPGQ